MKLNAMVLVAAVGLSASAASAQSLFLRQVSAVNENDPSFVLRGVSMFYVEPPKPTEFNVHDVVTIIVDETSNASSSSSLETSKEYSTDGSLTAFPDIQALIKDWAIRQGVGTTTNLGLEYEREFTGEGDYTRSDRLTVRLTGTVIDVKPNGNIVLEARKEVTTDGETKIMVLSGTCRGRDVTRNNTVLSTQLADLRFELKHEGELRDAAKKGVIPKIIDAIFNF